MHWTTHVIFGAAAGYLIGRPLPAALAGFASHLFLDVTPHYDPDSEIGYIADSVAGCATLACIAAGRKFRELDANRAVLWGAIGSALPDVELLVKLFKDIETEDFYLPWHDGTLPHRQTHVTGSTVSQLALILLMLALVRLKSRGGKVTRA